MEKKYFTYRKYVPSIPELNSLKTKNPIICRISFIDGRKKAVYIDSGFYFYFFFF